MLLKCKGKAVNQVRQSASRPRAERLRVGGRKQSFQYSAPLRGARKIGAVVDATGDDATARRVTGDGACGAVSKGATPLLAACRSADSRCGSSDLERRKRAEEDMRKWAETEAARKRAEEEQPCPFCAESIQIDAVACQYCGSTLVERRGRYKRTSGDLGLRWAIGFSIFDFATNYLSFQYTALGLIQNVIATAVTAFLVSYFVSRFYRKREWKPGLEWLFIGGALVILVSWWNWNIGSGG